MHDDMHFGLVVDDFDAVLARLAAAGAPWKPQADLFGGRRGSTRDPLGNRVELIEREPRQLRLRPAQPWRPDILTTAITAMITITAIRTGRPCGRRCPRRSSPARSGSRR